MFISPTDTAQCPCGAGDDYGSCCAPLLRRQAEAPTAVALMRSRYTAFCVGDAEYLRYSWHPEHCPQTLDLDAEDPTFSRLIISDHTAGGLFDTTGTVRFIACYTDSLGRHGRQEENSLFARFDGRWVYCTALSCAF